MSDLLDLLRQERIKHYLDLACDARAERVQLCKRLAQSAQSLADAAAPKFREGYLNIARSWLQLAAEMEGGAVVAHAN